MFVIKKHNTIFYFIWNKSEKVTKIICIEKTQIKSSKKLYG